MQIAIIAFVAFAVAALSGHWLIPALRKLHFGQSILEIGPNWHKDKEGTPTMGGVMFIVGILAASLLAFLFLADAPVTFWTLTISVSNALIVVTASLKALIGA